MNALALRIAPFLVQSSGRYPVEDGDISEFDFSPQVQEERLVRSFRVMSRVRSFSRYSRRLTEAVEVVLPTVHVHVHWHAPDEIQLDSHRRAYSMGMDSQTRNLANLDIAPLRWSWLDDPKLRV